MQISWDDAIALIARKLRDAIDDVGAGSLGVLGGADLTNEELALLGQITQTLGIVNRDWRVGRARAATLGPWSGTYRDLENAQLIVALGRPPAQNAPVMDLRIRKAVLRGNATYVVVGDHIAGSAIPVMRAADLADLAPLLEGVQRVAFVWDGIDPALGAAASDLIEALVARAIAVHAFVTSEFANARGAEAFGIVPATAANGADAVLDAAREGHVRVLVLVGADPVLTHPAGPTAVRDALERVDFVVATDLFLRDTTRLANLILPVCGPFEKAGHTYDLAGEVTTLRIAQDRPEGVLTEGEILVAIASELGLTIPAPGDLAQRAVAALIPRARVAALAAASTARQAQTGDVRVAVAASVFAGGGFSFFDERFAALRPTPRAILHPQTAAAAHVADGDVVDVVADDTDGRSVRGLDVALDELAVPGVVVVFDGLPEAPANVLRDGGLVRLENVVSRSRELTGRLA